MFDRLVVNCNSYVKKAVKLLTAKEIVQKKLQQFQFRWCHVTRIKFFSCLYVNKKILLICFIKEITKLFIANNLRRWKMFTFKHVRIFLLYVQFVLHSIVKQFSFLLYIVMPYCLWLRRWFIQAQLCTIMLIKVLPSKFQNNVAVNLLVNKF